MLTLPLARQREIITLLGQTLLDIAAVMDVPEPQAPPTVTLPPGSQRDVKVRKDGSLKMWARPQQEKDEALFQVLGVFVANGGVIDVEDFKAVATRVGYDTRGLAGFSTGKSNLVVRDPQDRSVRRLTENGYRRYRALLAARKEAAAA